MTCCEKGGRCGRQACRVQRWHHRGDVVFRTGGLAYDTPSPCRIGMSFRVETSLFEHCSPSLGLWSLALLASFFSSTLRVVYNREKLSHVMDQCSKG